VPTYQYVCTNPEDKHEFEVVQSFSDPAVSVCPTCGAPVRKVYGSVGVVFKGSGFYRTDSRKAESSTTPASSSGSKDSGGSSSKDGGGAGSGKDSTGSSSSSTTGTSSSGGSSSGSSAASSGSAGSN